MTLAAGAADIGNTERWTGFTVSAVGCGNRMARTDLAPSSCLAFIRKLSRRASNTLGAVDIGLEPCRAISALDAVRGDLGSSARSAPDR